MNKAKFFLSFFFIVLIVFLFFLFSYLNVSENNYVRFVKSPDNLKIESIFPITDYAGKMTEASKDGKNIFYNFKVKNYGEKNSRYKILLKVKNRDNSIDDKYVKILLSDSKDEILSKYDKDSYLTLNYLDKEKNNYILYKSSLGAGEETSYTLRLWISDRYKEEDLDKVFEAEIAIYSY